MRRTATAARVAPRDPHRAIRGDVDGLAVGLELTARVRPDPDGALPHDRQGVEPNRNEAAVGERDSAKPHSGVTVCPRSAISCHPPSAAMKTRWAAPISTKPKRVAASDALQDIDRLATAALRETARKKRLMG